MTIRYIFILLFFSCCWVSCAQNIPNAADQIAAATLAAPEEMRPTASVLGYDAKGELVTLREGTGNLICITDDPNQEGFKSVCYHTNLEPYMTRGRVLKVEGKNGQESFDIREAEAKSGVLNLPETPSTLHVYEGPGEFDATTGTVSKAFYRYVVYIPWATAESTGLPTKPMTPGGAWIMNPGTHRAHIMVTPPRE